MSRSFRCLLLAMSLLLLALAARAQTYSMATVPNPRALVILPPIGDAVPKQFATALFEHWGIARVRSSRASNSADLRGFAHRWASFS